MNHLHIHQCGQHYFAWFQYNSLYFSYSDLSCISSYIRHLQLFASFYTSVVNACMSLIAIACMLLASATRRMVICFFTEASHFGASLLFHACINLSCAILDHTIVKCVSSSSSIFSVNRLCTEISFPLKTAYRAVACDVTYDVLLPRDKNVRGDQGKLERGGCIVHA